MLLGWSNEGDEIGLAFCARWREERCLQEFGAKPEGQPPLCKPEIVDWINLTQDGKEWCGLTCGFHEMQEISWQDERIEILQGGVCSLDFASYDLEYFPSIKIGSQP